jgi:CSLREA domain-containing protein
MKTLSHRPAVMLIAFLALAALTAHPSYPVRAAPSVIVLNVNSLVDAVDEDTSDGLCRTAPAGPAQGRCTLRAAVMQANKLTGPGVDIILPSGTYTLTRPPVSSSLEPDNGDLNLRAPVSGHPLIRILGAGAAGTIVDANQLDRVFAVEAGRDALISGLTVRNGYMVTGIAGGGAIFNDGTLTLDHTAVYSSYAGFVGGGLYNTGSLTVLDSTFAENRAQTYGGAIDSGDDATVSGSLIFHNSAQYGGGLFSTDVLTLTNTTVSQNAAETDGGGLYSYGTLDMYNITVVFNEADSDIDFAGAAGGIYNGGATASLRNSIVAGNYRSNSPEYDECAGTLSVYGVNLFYHDAFSVPLCTVNGPGNSNWLNSLVLIGPLGNYGGPTRTHPLLPGSNAIDGGDNAVGCIGPTSALLPTDQRGARRPADGDHNHIAVCDVGAFEVQLPLLLPLLRR